MYARAGPLASLSCPALFTDCSCTPVPGSSNSVLTAACSDNHKPTLASGTRATNLKAADNSNNNTYELSLRDTKDAGNTDMFVFSGSRTAPSKSYVLVFDQTTQKATLDRLDSTYTFNLQTKNGADVSAEHGKIYPKKAHKDSVHDREEGEVDLFGDEDGEEANAGTEADAANPYDFRHFLNAAKGKKEKEKEAAEERGGYASSPDARGGGSQTARNSTATATAPALPVRRAVEQQAPKKRKAASVFAKKPAPKSAPKKPPTITLQRKATEPSASVSKTAAAAPASKIKSAEFVADSDDSDIDAEGDPDSTAPSPKVPQQQAQQQQQQPPPQRNIYRTYSPPHSSDSENNIHSASEEEEEGDGGHSDLEIEIPDARSNNSHSNNRNLNINDQRARSLSAGPISLASAANSAANTPSRHRAAPEEIDFGSLGDGDGDAEGEEEGGVEAAEVDEDDPLYMEMMEGLAGGESSEESEEE